MVCRKNAIELLFENLKPLLGPNEVAELLKRKVSTIYDWKYRSTMRNIPDDLFIKLKGRLLINRDVLKTWLISQN